ncbi:MAG: 2-phosphosulfolactate phosphatase [Lachnospiraceae bacterium]|nr:2-phosphosulfolactate phosphatase [Lachnospiraceae bacterium]
MFNGQIDILYYIEGAKKAEGLTVIIDVFRAFSLECYLYEKGVKVIRPVETIEETFTLGKIFSNSVLIGERKGKKCEGFDFGNSPSAIEHVNLEGKIIIHTTSAGTQGIVNAKKAEEIITGSLVNARAVASYILKKNPKKVSLVCMGNNGVTPAPEDELCAFYIKSILEGKELENFDKKVADLQVNGGEHFFKEENREVFPREDFWYCIKYDKFPFIIRVEKDETGYYTIREFLDR